MTRARTNSVFGEMISVSVPVTSCAESSSTDTLVSLGATPKATTRSAATTPPSLLTPVYHYQHPRHHMALSTVLGVFFGVLGTILLSLVIETRVGLHAIGDMTLPASTTTAPKSTSPVTTTAAPLSLTGCLTSVASVAVPLFGLGDSHGRDLLQSPLVRLGETHMDKERHWTRVIPLSDRQSNIRYDYHGTPRTYGIHTRHAPHLSPDTHILLSRGTWDLMKYSTPLSKYYAEVKALVRGAAATGAASVTFKTVHRFAAPTAELGFFAECTSADIVGAYRRVGACAVAAHNREAAAATSGERLKQVAVLDAWDATSRWPRVAFADDGHHLVGDYLHSVADAFLGHAVCPVAKAIHGTKTHHGIWIGSNATHLAERFGCGDVDAHLASAEVAADNVEGLPHHDPLDAFFNLGPRQGCRCMNPTQRLNDHCTFSRMSAAFTSGSSRFSDTNSAASTMFNYACTLQAQATPGSLWWRTGLALDDSGIRQVGAASFAMCADRAVADRCVHALSTAGNDTIRRTCLTPRLTSRVKALHQHWRRFERAYAKEFGAFPAAAVPTTSPALACSDLAMARKFFSVACGDGWLQSDAVRQHIIQQRIRSVAARGQNRRQAEDTEGDLRFLRSLEKEFAPS